MKQQDTPRRYAWKIGGGLVGVLLIAGFVWFVHTMMNAKTSKQQRQVQMVQIIRPPPPPPEQPPPPPEKIQETLPKDEPEPTPKENESRPEQPLGLDADGAAGGDAFGLEARHGGSDLVGGNGTAAFAWYTNRLKDQLLQKLGADSRLGSKRFSVSVRVWIENDGRIREFKLTSTTGSAELDQRIQSDLASLTRLSDAPPLEMPQPISLKIVSHT
jgi:periplasmic protein TonB